MLWQIGISMLLIGSLALFGLMLYVAKGRKEAITYTTPYLCAIIISCLFSCGGMLALLLALIQFIFHLIF